MLAWVAFSVLSQGLPLEAPGICGLGVRPPPTHGLGARLAAGHLWHMLIQQGGQKAPNTATGYPNICLPTPSPARSPGSEQFKGLIAFPGKTGGILVAAGDGTEQLLGPGAWTTACYIGSSSLRNRKVTPGPAGQSGCLLSPCLGSSFLAHPTSCCLFLMISGSSSS